MKARKVKVTVLVDNYAKNQKLKSEHGIAYWIKAGDFSILFDTGQGTALPVNVKRMKVSLGQCSAIVISHGHYDHTGGIAFALEKCPDALIYGHPDVIKKRYSLKPGRPVKSIGIPLPMWRALNKAKNKIRWIRKPIEIADGIWVTGPIPRISSFEDTGGNFFDDRTCKKRDLITDDQAMWIETNHGLIVLLGCGHSGVANTIRYVSKLTNHAPIHAVLGGMHLLNASGDRLNQTIRALKRAHLRWMMPGHCTGDVAVEYLKRHFKNRFRKMYVGMRFPFEGKRQMQHFEKV